MLIELLLQPLADAYLQVGVFVGLMLLAFAGLQQRYGQALMRALARRRRAAPAVGALLGVTPGCGGAILVVPLYLRGTVSFGTVIAALVATMGDASFVLLATDLRLGLQVHAALLLAGLVTGYAIDLLGVAPARGVPAGSTVGAAEALPPARRLPLAHPAALGPTARWPVAFWVLLAVGLLLALPLAAQAVDGPSLARHLGGIDPVLLVGVSGTLAAVAVHLRTGRAVGGTAVGGTAVGGAAVGGTAAPAGDPDAWPTVLRATARETATVTTWVAAAYVLTALAIAAGADPTVIATAGGWAGVLAGAAIGLVPGCAPQVLLAGLHASGLVPVPTLVANAGSQDGDALLPLLVADRRSALVATAITTVPGLALGGAWLLLGG